MMEKILSQIDVKLSVNEQLLSVVIPVYNEAEGLDALFARLYPSLDKLKQELGLPYEIVFINDWLALKTHAAI